MLRRTVLCANYISLDQVAKVVHAKLCHSPAVAQTYLIDVRSTREVAQTGLIPSAVNIPLYILTDVLDTTSSSAAVSDETFSETFGLVRPEPGTSRLIFYCSHGVRSAMAVHLAEELGYEGAMNFSGSWAQWYYTYGPATVQDNAAS